MMSPGHSGSRRVGAGELDDATVDRLLDGHVDPDDAPPTLRRVAALLADARVPALDPSGRDEVVDLLTHRSPAAVVTRRRAAGWSRRTVAIALGAVCFTGAVGAAAATGVVPLPGVDDGQPVTTTSSTPGRLGPASGAGRSGTPGGSGSTSTTTSTSSTSSTSSTTTSPPTTTAPARTTVPPSTVPGRGGPASTPTTVPTTGTTRPGTRPTTTSTPPPVSSPTTAPIGPPSTTTPGAAPTTIAARAPGRSADAPGHSADAPGHSADAPGKGAVLPPGQAKRSPQP